MSRCRWGHLRQARGGTSEGGRAWRRRSITVPWAARRSRYIVAGDARYVPSSSRVAHTVAGDSSTNRSECKTSSTSARSSSPSARRWAARRRSMTAAESGSGRRRRHCVARDRPHTAHAAVVAMCASSPATAGAITASTSDRCPRSWRALRRAPRLFPAPRSPSRRSPNAARDAHCRPPTRQCDDPWRRDRTGRASC